MSPEIDERSRPIKRNNHVLDIREDDTNDINELIDEINALGDETFNKVLDKKWLTKSDFSSTYQLFERLGKLGEKAFGDVLERYDPDAVLQEQARSRHPMSQPIVPDIPDDAAPGAILDESGGPAIPIPDDDGYPAISASDTRDDILDTPSVSPDADEYPEQEINDDVSDISSLKAEDISDKAIEKDEKYGTVRFFNNIGDFVSTKLQKIKDKSDNSLDNEKNGSEQSFFSGIRKFVDTTLQKIKEESKLSPGIQSKLQKEIDDLVDTVDTINKENASVFEIIGSFIKNTISLFKDEEIDDPAAGLNILDYLEPEDDMYGPIQHETSLGESTSLEVPILDKGHALDEKKTLEEPILDEGRALDEENALETPTLDEGHALDEEKTLEAPVLDEGHVLDERISLEEPTLDEGHALNEEKTLEMPTLDEGHALNEEKTLEMPYKDKEQNLEVDNRDLGKTRKRELKTREERIKNIHRAKGAADRIVINDMPIKIGIQGSYSYIPIRQDEIEYYWRNRWFGKCATEMQKVYREMVALELSKLLLFKDKDAKEKHVRSVNVVYVTKEHSYVVQGKVNNEKEWKTYVVPEDNWSKFRFDAPVYLDEIVTKPMIYVEKGDLKERSDELDYYNVALKNMLIVLKNIEEKKNKRFRFDNKVTLFGREMTEEEKDNFDNLKYMVNKMETRGPLKDIRYTRNKEDIIEYYCY